MAAGSSKQTHKNHKKYGFPLKKSMNNSNFKKDTTSQSGNKSIKKKSAVESRPLSTNETDIFPSLDTALKAFLSARFCAAIWSHITDCDETYNYWEPTHYLLFGKGFQTWEYSPQYALRSYTYLLIHVLPAWLYSQLFQLNRILIFYFLRCLLGLFCAICESYFYKAVCMEFGSSVGRLVLIFLVFSPGMFISSTAYLPSSFSMYMVLLSMGAWFNRKYELAIFATALSTFLSWPFSALVGAFIALDVLLVKKLYWMFFKWSLISTVVILIPIAKIDSDFFGRFVIAPLNIVLYNVFSSHGPNIYGISPPEFYFINAFLNFNFIFLAAISTPIIVVIRWKVSSQRNIPLHFWLSIAPFYIWMLVFTVQPHKEERFLYPVYPLICLCGAISVHSLQILINVSKWFRSTGKLFTMLFIVITSLLGISRTVALYRGYHGVMDVYLELGKLHVDGRVPPGLDVNVCVGKEWYRFPNSFFLPTNEWHLRFIESEFRGQLPAEYSPGNNGTRLVHKHFNDLNREEVSRYFDVNKCHFLIDFDSGQYSSREPNYSAQSDRWILRVSVPFLDATQSNKLYRAFYIPFMSDKHCVYGSYNLLQSTRIKLKEI